MADDLESKFAGLAYSELLSAEVRTEEGRRASLETRAAGVLATSGVLVTVLAAVVTIGAGPGTAKLTVPALTFWSLVVAIGAFAGSALLALLVFISWSRLYPYLAPNLVDVRRNVEEHWDALYMDAAQEVALQQLRSVESARVADFRKAALLLGAVTLNALAISCLAVSVIGFVGTRLQIH